jgi:hypothetical protein
MLLPDAFRQSTAQRLVEDGRFLIKYTTAPQARVSEKEVITKERSHDNASLLPVVIRGISNRRLREHRTIVVFDQSSSVPELTGRQLTGEYQ